MNLRTHKRQAAAGILRRLQGRRACRTRLLFTSHQLYVGWVRCTRLDGGIRWVHQYTAIAR